MSSRLYREILERDGFVILRRFMQPGYMKAIRSLAVELIERQSLDERKKVISLGSIGRVEESPLLLQYALEERLLRRMEIALDLILTYHVGIVFAKPLDSAATFWHQDYIAWGEPRATDAEPSYIQLLWYLDATSRGSGCLRVIPGTHRRLHPLHFKWRDAIIANNGDARAFNARLRQHDLAYPWAYGDAEGSVDVPVEPGDLVVLDSRTLHSAWPNNELSERYLLTISLAASFLNFSHNFQAGIAAEVKAQRSGANQDIFDAARSRLPDFSPVPSLSAYRSIFPSSFIGFSKPE